MCIRDSICTFPRPFQQSVFSGERFPLCPVALQHFRTMVDILLFRVMTLLCFHQNHSNVFISHLLQSEILCHPTICQEIYSDSLFICVLFFLYVAVSAAFGALSLEKPSALPCRHPCRCTLKLYSCKRSRHVTNWPSRVLHLRVCLLYTSRCV